MKLNSSTEIPFVSMAVLTQDLVNSFSVAGADPNPIHLSHDAAIKAGLKAPIAHGMLLATLINSRIEQLGISQKYFLRSSQFRFRSMTFIGETIWVGGKVVVASDTEIEIEATARGSSESGDVKTTAKFRYQSLG